MSEILIKKGTVLVANSVCKMTPTDEESLTIGKKYTVIEVDYENDEFFIIDDVYGEHYFDITNYKDYFDYE